MFKSILCELSTLLNSLSKETIRCIVLLSFYGEKSSQDYCMSKVVAFSCNLSGCEQFTNL